jgi:hypothetical protein
VLAPECEESGSVICSSTSARLGNFGLKVFYLRKLRMPPDERFGFWVSGHGTRFFVLGAKEFVTVL